MQVWLRQQRSHLLYEGVGGAPGVFRAGGHGEVPIVQGGLWACEAVAEPGEEHGQDPHSCREREA